ncbi:MAG: cobalamin B12-binding domain-containing protein [Desulfatibacillaceae bacterium]|nr:cobalamin B12-binding domain-containing protein [Desulfatibacillaceae bacterium]
MNSPEKKIRVLVAKVGLDGHDKGAYIVASILRDAGMEVIYSGLRRTVGQVINSVIQEDVDVLGLSILSGAHETIARKIIDAMKENAIDDKLFIVGGVIPDEDIEKLKKMGVDAVFTQSSNYNEMTDFIRSHVK